MNAKNQFDENTVCEVCGKFGAFQFGDRRLCAECYQAIGSCCPEFGGYDQWEFEEEGTKRFPEATIERSDKYDQSKRKS